MVPRNRKKCQRRQRRTPASHAQPRWNTVAKPKARRVSLHRRPLRHPVSTAPAAARSSQSSPNCPVNDLKVDEKTQPLTVPPACMQSRIPPPPAVAGMTQGDFYNEAMPLPLHRSDQEGDPHGVHRRRSPGIRCTIHENALGGRKQDASKAAGRQFGHSSGCAGGDAPVRRVHFPTYD